MTDPDFPRDPLTWRFNRRLEADCVRNCSKALFTTSGALEMYAERYPDIPASRWSVIENGYDEANFAEAEARFERRALGQGGQLTLIHSGILYPEERDPRPFFAALATLKRDGEISAAGLQVVLRASGSDSYYQSLLRDHGIEDLVILAPPISYREALREMLCADGLLLFQGSMCNHQIPAKLYEYLRASQPILALTDPEGNTAEALRATGDHVIVEITSEQSILVGLRRFLVDLKTGRAPRTLPATAALNSRRARTAELGALLDQMTLAVT